MPFMGRTNYFYSAGDDYARFRPGYQPALGAWLSSCCGTHSLALDVATGSGQAACIVAPHFDRVLACDASLAQIVAATAPAHVAFAIARAESLPVPDAVVDLLTVAQAMHWFDQQAFHAEVRRVLRPGGVIAAWTYNLLEVDPAVDALVHGLYRDVLRDDWPAERRHVENGYADLPFPYVRMAAPAFVMQAQWDARQLLGYLQTWSAVRRYRARTGSDPVAVVAAALRESFGGGTRTVRWPLALHVGRRK